MSAVLLMLWCLAGACEEVRAPTALDWQACATFGQHYASDWQRANPAYADHRLRRWRCQVGERA